MVTVSKVDVNVFAFASAHWLGQDHVMKSDMKRLRALAPFLSKFEAPGAFPSWERNPVAWDFIDACYKAGWIMQDFDGTEWRSWVEWKSSDEALRLRDDPAALQSAAPEQIGRLLTVLIRQDRFVEGSLAGAFESGFLVDILRRIAELAARPTEERPTGR